MTLFTLRKESIYAIPIIHYTMELATHVKMAFETLQPDCIAVELPETCQNVALHAASRLPDISVIQCDQLYYLCEPCDAIFEALRCALEKGKAAFCIDLDVNDYPSYQETLPDPYSIIHIGLENYFNAYQNSIQHLKRSKQDDQREQHMAKRLKELSFHYDKILFVGGFYHVTSVLNHFSNTTFDHIEHVARESIQLVTLTEDSCRDVMAECGFISSHYELWREQISSDRLNFLDRHWIILQLYKKAAERYREITGNLFLSYHLRNTLKFARNYAFIHHKLLPNLFEMLSAAKGCVDHNYAYETWYLATTYPYRKNIDNLKELPLTIEEVWGSSKKIHFHLKAKRRKGLEFHRRAKDRPNINLRPPSPFGICSYPPEDLVVENFGEFLKKKGNLLLSEETSRIIPFSMSLEDGVDMRETIRHLYEKKLYVRAKGKPPGAVGSIAVIFDEDVPKELCFEKFSWKTTWHGEHTQESDMAFYATHLHQNIVGPGISRCEYGGFMMSYPPRRLYDIWNDADYCHCRSKAEILLMAAIDYSLKPLVVYVAEKAPRSKIKSFANRFGKKIIYIPLGQLSPIMLNKIRVFHVLDGHDKREIAGDYII